MNILPPVSSIQMKVDLELTDGIRSDLLFIKDGIKSANAKQTQLVTIVDELESQNSILDAADAKVQAEFNDLKKDPNFADMLAEMDFSMPEGQDTPDFTEIREMLSQNSGMNADDVDEYLDMLDFDNQNSMDFDMNGEGELPDDVLQRLQSSSVTTITDDVVYLVRRMFEINTPAVVAEIQDGINDGIDGIGEGIAGLSDATDGISEGLDGLNSGIEGIGEGIDGIQQGVDGMNEGIASMDDAVIGLRTGITGVKKGINKMERGVSGIKKGIAGMQQGISGLDAQISSTKASLEKSIADGEPPSTWGPIQGKLEGLKAARSNLLAKLNDAEDGKADLEKAIRKMRGNVSNMKSAITSIQSAKQKTSALITSVAAERELMISLQSEMKEAAGLMSDLRGILTGMSEKMSDAQTRLMTLRDSIPSYFDAALTAYTNQVQEKKPEIEDTFQRTINTGFTRMYYAVAVLCILACIGLTFYRQPVPLD